MIANKACKFYNYLKYNEEILSVSEISLFIGRGATKSKLIYLKSLKFFISY